jgi:adenine-specific DNA-methyltransferase
MPTASAHLLRRASIIPTHIERVRAEASRTLDAATRRELGQYFTPWGLASLMATFFERFTPTTRLLDAGAGVGTLTAAAISEAWSRAQPPSRIDVVAYETDPCLLACLNRTLALCKRESDRHGIRFSSAGLPGDFVFRAVAILENSRLRPNTRWFTHAILNPPYRKLHSNSTTRRLLRSVGIETSNLYTGFVALAVELLEPGGELVAITPRSFCNGPYFRPFRQYLLEHTGLRRIHVFESRSAAFADDKVLQENVIVHVAKGAQQERVLVSTSARPEQPAASVREVRFEQIARSDDPQSFIRVVPGESAQELADTHASLPCALGDLGLAVSTGRVVDFRARAHLRKNPGGRAQPLIYPTHFSDGLVRWPKTGRKPNALADIRATAPLWMPSGTYVLTKRFTSKEERRRIVAAIFDPKHVPAEKVGFENHLNVFHANGAGLDPSLARGLLAFLNSTFVDEVFRHWSGHTQVNATDLRSLRYPSAAVLRRLGSDVAVGASQRVVDAVVDAVVGVG